MWKLSNTNRTMSNSASTLPSVLNTIQKNVTFIILPIFVILGILGNAFCIFYFLQKSQRASSCALYLSLAAMMNMFAITFGTATNILNALKAVAATSIIYCKLRMYINHTSILIARVFIVLASIDTYAMTSARHTCRLFSRRSNAVKYVLAVLICCPIIAVHIPIMNTIVAGQCVMTGVYSLIFTIYQMLIAGILPPLVMMIFSCLAYLNMKKVRVGPENVGNRTKRHQQQQLVRMVTTQITIYIISAELNPITTLYKQITANVTDKSQDQKAVESFIIFISSNILLYLNTWAPFFVYYATSSSFRNAFIRMFKKTNQIQSVTFTAANNMVTIKIIN